MLKQFNIPVIAKELQEYLKKELDFIYTGFDDGYFLFKHSQDYCIGTPSGSLVIHVTKMNPTKVKLPKYSTQKFLHAMPPCDLDKLALDKDTIDRYMPYRGALKHSEYVEMHGKEFDGLPVYYSYKDYRYK